MRLWLVVSIISIVNAAIAHRLYIFLCALKNDGIYKDRKNVNVSLDKD